MRTYYVYIMASRSRTLYTGVTRDLTGRVSEHKQKLVPGFTSRYNIGRLVYYEDFRDIRAAIAREKTDQGMAPLQENRIDPVKEPSMAGLERGVVRKSRCFAALSMTGDRPGRPGVQTPSF
jgi:putative endonuclease